MPYLLAIALVLAGVLWGALCAAFWLIVGSQQRELSRLRNAQERRQRFSQLADPLLEPFGLSDAQRILAQADAMETEFLRPRRKNRMWTWRMRMRGQ